MGPHLSKRGNMDFIQHGKKKNKVSESSEIHVISHKRRKGEIQKRISVGGKKIGNPAKNHAEGVT